MAKKSKIVRNEQRVNEVEKTLAKGKKPAHAIRVRNRCNRCGRPRGFIRLFGLCRSCLREMASKGEVAGLKKSSW
ncbi:MAG: type Z 30S ribosomal protein S14 [Candidatus Gracilibacteria bacterium]|jgi:small subunit ribosomal protein S14|nr:type Z 30S ribosomal protein S14 [Candidatus Gracilibacteria bacterium]